MRAPTPDVLSDIQRQNDEYVAALESLREKLITDFETTNNTTMRDALISDDTLSITTGEDCR